MTNKEHKMHDRSRFLSSMRSFCAMNVSLLTEGSYSKKAWRGIVGGEGGYARGWEVAVLGLLQG